MFERSDDKPLHEVLPNTNLFNNLSNQKPELEIRFINPRTKINKISAFKITLQITISA